jgi:hypothetical protein
MNIICSEWNFFLIRVEKYEIKYIWLEQNKMLQDSLIPHSGYQNLYWEGSFQFLCFCACLKFLDESFEALWVWTKFLSRGRVWPSAPRAVARCTIFSLPIKVLFLSTAFGQIEFPVLEPMSRAYSSVLRCEFAAMLLPDITSQAP